MKKQAYQKPTIYNSDGTKAQTGTFDIRADPLTNSTADGILDYINNNLEALYDNTMGGTGGEINTETITGKTGNITNFTATTVKAGTLTLFYDLTFPNADCEISPTGADGQKAFSILAHAHDFNYSRIVLSSKTNGNGDGYIYIISHNGKDSSQLLLTPTGASYNKTLKTTIDGNAATATKLQTARTINVTDADGTHTGTGVSFNGTGDAVITLPYDIDLTSLNFPLSGGQIRRTGAQESKSLAIFSKANDFTKPLIELDPVNNKIDIKAGDGTTAKIYRFSMNGAEFSITGNAASATKLQTARTINVQDASASNTGTGASFNGSDNATIKLPAKIKATLNGNADTATNATNDANGNPIAGTYLDKLTTTVQKVTAPIQHTGTPSSNDELVNKSYVDTAISNYVYNNIFRESKPAGATITDKLNNASGGITYWVDYNSASYSPTGANGSWSFKIVKFGQSIRYWICEAQNADTRTAYRFINNKWYQVGLTALS